MARWTVCALYPDLGIKKRITVHNSAEEVGQYKLGLAQCDTPYFVLKSGKLVEVHTGSTMTKSEMADYVEEYC